MAVASRHGQEDAALPRGAIVRHPLEHLKHEVQHLREVAEEGESAATPVILIAAIMLVLVPYAALWIWLVLSLYNSAV
jgi:hypothetical protein